VGHSKVTVGEENDQPRSIVPALVSKPAHKSNPAAHRSGGEAVGGGLSGTGRGTVIRNTVHVEASFRFTGVGTGAGGALGLHAAGAPALPAPAS
jgi:hypothetical protein